MPQKVGIRIGVPFGRGKTFSPSDIANLFLWLDAGNGVTVAGSGVSEWQDQSGNARHYTQANDANRPALIADSINGKPTVKFTSGSSHFLQLAANHNIAGPFTVFIVTIMDMVNNVKILGYTNSIWYVGAAHQYNYFRGGDTLKLFRQTDAVLDQGHINEMYRDVGNDIYSFRDGVASINNPLNDSGLQANRYLANSAGTYYDCNFGEVVLYNAHLSDGDRTKVYNYLKNKYTL